MKLKGFEYGNRSARVGGMKDECILFLGGSGRVFFLFILHVEYTIEASRDGTVKKLRLKFSQNRLKSQVQSVFYRKGLEISLSLGH